MLRLEMLVRPAPMGAKKGWNYSFGESLLGSFEVGASPWILSHIYLQAMLPQTL